MKKYFKKLIGIGLAVGAAALVFLSTPAPAQQQPNPPTNNASPAATYVAPRIVTLWSGVLTNFTYTNLVTLGNLMNPSGWHNINLILSEWGFTNNGTTITPFIIGTNSVTVTIRGSPGNGSGYTNGASGTNYAFIQPPLLVWPNAVSPAAPYMTNNPDFAWTNITQALGDGMQWFSFTVSVTATNTALSNTNSGIGLQLDAVLTP